MHNSATADLDTRIEAAAQASYDARSTLALLIEERLTSRLRSVMPGGGTLHLDHWSDGQNSGVTLMTVTAAGATPDYDQEVEDILGDLTDAIRADVEDLQHTGMPGCTWRPYTLDFTF